MQSRLASIASLLLAATVGCEVHSNLEPATVGVQGSVVAGGEIQGGVAPQGSVVGQPQGAVVVQQNPGYAPQGQVIGTVQTPGVGVGIAAQPVTVPQPPQGGVSVVVGGHHGHHGHHGQVVAGPQGAVVGVVQPSGGYAPPQGGVSVGGSVQGGVSVGGSITTGVTPSGGSITTGVTPGGAVVVTGPTNSTPPRAGMLPTGVVQIRPTPGAVTTTTTMPTGVPTAPMGATVVTTGAVPGTTPVGPMGATTVTTGTMPGTTPVAPMGATTVTTGVVPGTTPGVPGRPTLMPGGTVTVSGTTPTQNNRNGIILAPHPDNIRRPIDPSQIRQPPPPVPSANVVITR